MSMQNFCASDPRLYMRTCSNLQSNQVFFVEMPVGVITTQVVDSVNTHKNVANIFCNSLCSIQIMKPNVVVERKVHGKRYVNHELNPKLVGLLTS